MGRSLRFGGSASDFAFGFLADFRNRQKLREKDRFFGRLASTFEPKMAKIGRIDFCRLNSAQISVLSWLQGGLKPSEPKLRTDIFGGKYFVFCAKYFSEFLAGKCQIFRFRASWPEDYASHFWGFPGKRPEVGKNLFNIGTFVPALPPVGPYASHFCEFWRISALSENWSFLGQNWPKMVKNGQFWPLLLAFYLSQKWL